MATGGGSSSNGSDGSGERHGVPGKCQLKWSKAKERSSRGRRSGSSNSSLWQVHGRWQSWEWLAACVQGSHACGLVLHVNPTAPSMGSPQWPLRRTCLAEGHEGPRHQQAGQRALATTPRAVVGAGDF